MLESIRQAVWSVRKNLLRSLLTVLGILIGVSSVIMVVSLGQGASRIASKQIETLGSNLITIMPQAAAASGAKQKTSGRLTEEDAKAIAREGVSILGVSPQIRSTAKIVYGDSNTSTQIIGATLQYFPLTRSEIADGAIWDEHDAITKSRVCILGETVRIALFGARSPVGSTIRIGRYPYRVIGILQPKGTAFGLDQDDIIVMPIGGARSRFSRSAPGQVNSILAAATSSETADRAIEQAKSILRARHHVAEGANPDFDVRSTKELQDIQATIAAVLSLLLVVIAGISLVVGGIGIMNIMLVSVTERTREIGIRMAIGARSSDIQQQFLVEAVMLSAFGGVLGILFGSVVVETFGVVFDWPMHPNLVATIVSLLVSALIGVAFGFLPARRAAKLDPIVALRYE